VLDHQDRERARQARDQVDHAAGLARRHARRRLVQQEEVGLAGKGDPDLELSLFAIGQVAGEARAVVAEVHALHQLLGARDHVAEARDRREEVERVAAARPAPRAAGSRSR
jgi:hypothetical protein